MNQKGQFSYAFIFAIIIITMLFIFAFIAPMLQAFLVGMYRGIEPVMDIAEEQGNQIDNNEIREEFLGVIDAQQDMVLGGNQVLSSLITYGGIFTIILVAIVFYLISRRNVEAGQLG